MKENFFTWRALNEIYIRFLLQMVLKVELQWKKDGISTQGDVAQRGNSRRW